MRIIPCFLTVIAMALPFSAPVRAQLTPSLTPIPAPTPAAPVQPARAVAQPPPVMAAQAAAMEKKEIPQWHGPYGGDTAFATQVVRSARMWESFWRRVDKEIPRKFDEATDMAVVVFAGECPTGGFIVKIVDAFVEQENFVVVYEVQAPGPDTFVTQVLTHPWGTAIVPRSDRTVVFRKALKAPGGR